MQIAPLTNLETSHNGRITLVNIFKPKPGQFDAFITAQIAEYKRLEGRAPGWTGNHLYRSLDGAAAVNIAAFQSVAAYQTWRQSALFDDHVDRISHFVTQAEPRVFGPPVYVASSDVSG